MLAKARSRALARLRRLAGSVDGDGQEETNTAPAYFPVRVARERGLFTLALLASTWLPLAFFIAVGSRGTPAGSVGSVKTALLFVGGIHVAATLVLYMDRKFLPAVRENKVRYVYAPLAVILLSGLIFTAGGHAVQLPAYLIFWAWQTHHYGRQNVGVYAFAAMAGGWRPQPLERRALDLAAACAICGTFKVLARDVAPPALQGLFDLLYRAGALAFIGVMVFSVYIYLKHRREFSVSRTVFFFTLVLFFSPMFLSDDIDVAFFSYATAHGAQYLTFMAALTIGLGAHEGRRGLSGGMVVAAGLMMALTLLGYLGADLKRVAFVGSSPTLATVLDFLAGIALGTAVAHFIVDAGAWRLSRPSARHYMAERFGFVFRRPAAYAGGVITTAEPVLLPGRAGDPSIDAPARPSSA